MICQMVLHSGLQIPLLFWVDVKKKWQSIKLKRKLKEIQIINILNSHM